MSNKLGYVPAINGIEMLMELLTDKNKFMGYLAELEDQRKAIEALLGRMNDATLLEQEQAKVAKALETADGLVEAAQKEYDEAMILIVEAEDDVDKRNSSLKKRKKAYKDDFAKLEEDQEAFQVYKNLTTKGLKMWGDKLVERENNLTSRAKTISAGEADLAEKVAAIYAAVN